MLLIFFISTVDWVSYASNTTERFLYRLFKESTVENIKFFLNHTSFWLHLEKKERKFSTFHFIFNSKQRHNILNQIIRSRHSNPRKRFLIELDLTLYKTLQIVIVTAMHSGRRLASLRDLNVFSNNALHTIT